MRLAEGFAGGMIEILPVNKSHGTLDLRFNAHELRILRRKE